MEKFKVTFLPDNKTVEAEKGKTILSAAISAGVYINSACGGDGVCGRCKVIIRKGKAFSQPTGLLSSEEKKQQVHLACLSAIEGDLEIEVPPESRQEQELPADLYEKPEEMEPVKPVIRRKDFAYAPLTQKVYLELPKPDLRDTIDDLERLYRQIKRKLNIQVVGSPLSYIRGLGELLRDAQWQVTATLAKKESGFEIVALEPGNTAKNNFGLAVDIGTTTLSCQLVDLNSSKTLGTKATYNKQASFGSDVITRIIHAQKEDGLEELHAAVAQGINQMIRELAREHGVDLNNLTAVVCAGNTTMIHLLLRIDPSYIRKEPYIPTANFTPVMHASEAGIKINPHGLLFCLPGIASYVGGDATAGVLSCGQEKEKDLCLLIDIGTNGEIVLGNSEFLISAAASAGPAFEGSGLSCGMRAGSGAIQAVKISPKDFSVKYVTIAGVRPRGICGSGYIDLLAEMLRAGIIDKNGKIKAGENKRLRQTESGKEFVVAFKAEADSSADIVVSEADIDNLKRAKAAIYSAASSLLRHVELSFSEVEKIFIAGGFGTSVNIENAITIGLLPDLEKRRFIFVGNSSLAGARQVLLAHQAREESITIARKMTYFELSVDAKYMDEYMAALFFPHTDLSKFRSVKL